VILVIALEVARCRCSEAQAEMQHLDYAYWRRARQVLASERGSDHGSQPWAALRRLSGELSHDLDPFHARALIELGLGLARPHVPSLQSAYVTRDGAIEGEAPLDERAEEAVLACVLGLVARVDGAERLQARLDALWPDDSDTR
jgi:hypothetical protein